MSILLGAYTLDLLLWDPHICGMSKEDRDIEKSYSNKEFAAKLRRLADCVESGENFEIQVAGERIYVPDRAEFTIEHEREDGVEELEFQVKWTK